MPEDPVRRESRALIAAAKSVGCYVETSAVPGTRYTIRSGESEVRLDQVNRLYYKIKNPFAKLHLKKHPVEFVLFEHVVHNVLFPDCRLEFLGIAEDCHEARLVFRQRAIRSAVRPDDGQIAAALRDLGLMPEGRYCFGNDFVFVTDVGQDGDNVLVDADEQLRFVDPIIGFKEPLLSLLPEQKVSPIVCGLYKLTKDEIQVHRVDDQADGVRNMMEEFKAFLAGSPYRMSEDQVEGWAYQVAVILPSVIKEWYDSDFSTDRLWTEKGDYYGAARQKLAAMGPFKKHCSEAQDMLQALKLLTVFFWGRDAQGEQREDG